MAASERGVLVLLLLSAPLGAAVPAAATTPTLPLHALHEVELRPSSEALLAVDNPFLVDLTLRAVHLESATSLTIGAFYDGNSTYRARFACSLPGRWAWSVVGDGGAGGIVSSSAAAQGAVTCLAPSARNSSGHGGLHVDAAHPHHFVWADGTRHFPMSYECDWIWALGLEPDTTPTSLESFLDSIQSGGFNQIVMNFYANHSGWDKAPKEFLLNTKKTPWASADQMTLNLEFFQHYDTVLAALQSRGIVAHIMIMVENKAVAWPTEQSPADDLYWSTIINRYQAFDNVVWDVSKEAHNLAASYWATRFALIEAKDAHHRLRTVHTLEKKEDFVPLQQTDCQFISHQQHGDYHNHILRMRKLYPSKPIFNIEFLYEMGSLQTYGPQSRSDQVREVMWSVVMAGGYANWYVSTTAWDVLVPGDVTPGYSYCRHLIAFFTSAEYWLLENNDAMLILPQESNADGWAMANPDGTEVLVYLSQAGSFQLRLPATATAARSTATTTVAGSASDTIVDLPTRTNGGLGVSSSSSWDGEWFDPCTGQRQPFTVTLTAGQQQAFVPPKIYSATSDVALRLTAAKAA